MPSQPSLASVERAARQAYGRLVAILAARSGDLALAEDSLAEALLAALERWPVDGVPANPQAWLLTVARRRSIDAVRRRARAEAAQAEVVRMYEEAVAAPDAAHGLPDRRLGLMLVCAHPVVDVAARAPLMLQVVLGLSAEGMAPLFLTSPAAMTKRLARAKAKIGAAGVGFDLPDRDQLGDRLEPVLDAVYAAFTIAREGALHRPLEQEALWLGRLIVELAPGEPEPLGLLALMLFVAARSAGADSQVFVPLSAQDPAAWDEALMLQAEARIATAARLGRPGRFQLEAAIQAVHADRRRTGRVDWDALLPLYDGLVVLSPTIGAHVSRAAALAQAGHLRQALAALDAIEPAHVDDYQPYWATRAFVLSASGDLNQAEDAYLRAAGLADSPAVRAWLLQQRRRLQN